MKKGTLAIVAAALAAFSLPAAAQSSSFNMSAVYAGAAVGQSTAKDFCNGISGCDDKDMTWGLFAGYRLHRNFAAEIGYHDLGSASGGGVSFDATAWELVGLGIAPLNDQFSVYGKLGFFRGQVKGAGITETNTDLTYGLGGQFDATQNIGIRVEWQRYPSMGGGALSKSDVDVLRVAALWRFQ